MSKKEKFKPYAAAYLVLIKDGQVLLLRRFNTGYQDGNYSLVAGHLDGGETTKQCIIREAREEAGIIVHSEDLEVVHVMHRLAPDREYFDIYLRAEKWTGEITNMEPDKCDELIWCNTEHLPDNMLPEVKLALENINEGMHYGEFGWKKGE
ncbi:MAG: NUDIX domain-containing protein [Candidatus Pacebacteria bacterium]|nr:NUDIX domain-containing protein [Candidatus Paceibacterota bacterium]